MAAVLLGKNFFGDVECWHVFMEASTRHKNLEAAARSNPNCCGFQFAASNA